MRRLSVPRPSASIVISSLALFVALSGTGVAVAAVVIPKDSVGAAQLKKSAVTTSKIKNNAVTSAKIKAGAVGGSDVADKSLTGADIKDGSLSASDLQGGQLRQGARAYATVVAPPIDSPDDSVGQQPATFGGDHPGLTAVARKSAGVYCLTPAAGVPAVNAHAQVTSTSTLVSAGLVVVFDTAQACPSGQIEVRVLSATNTPVEAVGFNILVP